MWEVAASENTNLSLFLLSVVLAALLWLSIVFHTRKSSPSMFYRLSLSTYLKRLHEDAFSYFDKLSSLCSYLTRVFAAPLGLNSSKWMRKVERADSHAAQTVATTDRHEIWKWRRNTRLGDSRVQSTHSPPFSFPVEEEGTQARRQGRRGGTTFSLIAWRQRYLVAAASPAWPAALLSLLAFVFPPSLRRSACF